MSPTRLVVASMVGLLVWTGQVQAQAPEAMPCSERRGPTMQSLLQGPEPVFIDPFSTRSVYRRILSVQFADSLVPEQLCTFLRKYDLLLLPGRFGVGWLRVLTVRRASSLEELVHWLDTMAEAPEVRAIGLVPPSAQLAWPLSTRSR
jgi:hypothetical protein